VTGMHTRMGGGSARPFKFMVWGNYGSDLRWRLTSDMALIAAMLPPTAALSTILMPFSGSRRVPTPCAVHMPSICLQDKVLGFRA